MLFSGSVRQGVSYRVYDTTGQGGTLTYNTVQYNPGATFQGAMFTTYTTSSPNIGLQLSHGLIQNLAGYKVLTSFSDSKNIYIRIAL